MAKRYGRKQKFKHRKLIAELIARLSYESTVHVYLPGDGMPELESIAHVVGYSVTEYGGHGQMIELSATVTVEAIGAVHELYRDRTTVQFMGKQYIVVNGTLGPGVYTSGPDHLELELVGVAS